jgi:hypothetical protein
MGDYERSAMVRMPVDDLFDYLSRVENLPRYVPRMTRAQPLRGDKVHVEASLEPGDVGSGRDATPEDEHAVAGNAWFRVDSGRRRLAWGARGPHEYHGELEVSESAGGSTVVVRLHTLREDADGIQTGLAEALDSLAELGAR